MIVTCEFCETSFQLDEGRIPTQGIRVRCSRCKEAFFLPHPSASDADAVHDVAGRAAATEAPTPPDSTQDLPPSSEVAGSDEINNEDDAEWEFNHEPRPEPDQDPAARADGNTFEAPVADEPSGLSLEGDDERLGSDDGSGIDLDDGGLDVDAAPESAFGSVDDFSSLMEEDPGEQVDGDLAEEDTGPLLGDTAPPDVEAGQTASPGASDELGDPENWDFFSEEASESDGAPTLTPLAKLDLVPSGSLDLSDMTGSWDDADYGEETAAPGHVISVLRFAGNAVGWLVTIGLVAIGLSSGLESTAESLVSTEQRLELGDLRTDPVHGDWLDTARAGRLLVVTGGLDNTGAGAAQLDGGLQLALLSAEGRRLDVDPSPLAIVLPEAELRELSREELRVARSRARYEFARRRVESRDALQFQAVFSDVPWEAARFVLERSPDADPPVIRGPATAAPDALDPLEGPGVPDALDPVAQPGIPDATPAVADLPESPPSPESADAI